MNLLASRQGRRLVAFAFYFAEGVPIGFIWWALPTILRKDGIGIEQIANFTSLLTLPWIFKFLWAPLVDSRRNRFFGFKHWIIASQSMMVISLVPLLFVPFKENVALWSTCLIVHAFSAATQDVSVDGLIIHVSKANEQGAINGVMQAGMLIGRALFGGAILLISDRLSIQGMVAAVILAIAIPLIIALFIHEVSPITNERPKKLLKSNLSRMFRSIGTWRALIFALTAAAAFECAGAFAGPFLVDEGLSQQKVGFFFAVPVVASMLTGSLIGGKLSDKIGHQPAMVIFASGVALFVGLLGLLTYLPVNAGIVTFKIIYGLIYFFTGMFTAASYAWFMQMTNKGIGATQFSLFMAATNGCEAWVVFVSGWLVSTSGYGFAYMAMALVTVLSLLFLWRSKSPYKKRAPL